MNIRGILSPSQTLYRERRDTLSLLSRKYTPNEKAKILSEALPYIKKFTKKIMVIKYGGNAMIDDKLKHSFAKDVVLLKLVGMHPIIVHGGGPQINKSLDLMGKKGQFHNGMRVTDKETMDVVYDVLNSINLEIVESISG